MTGNDRYDKARALFLALVMVVSVFGMTVAFSGSAVATVDDVNGLSAEDVTPGTDQVIQQVTIQGVENNNQSDTINISSDALDSSIVNASATEVNTANGHAASVRTVTDGGTIVVDLEADSGTTADITLDVGLNLSEPGALEGSSVTYTATTEASDISVSDTFEVTEKQPAFANGSVIVPEDAPNTLEVTFDRDIQVTDNNGISAAFTLTNVNNSTDSQLKVNGWDGISSDTITLSLDGYVGSNASADAMLVEFDGSALAHADNADVSALASTDEEVTNNARPALEHAAVTDENNDQVVMTFSEDLDSGSNSDIASAFSLADDRADINNDAGVVVENTSTDPKNEVILNLSDSIAPGSDLSGLEYDGNALTASDGGANLYNFTAGVSNDVVPTLQSAKVTDTNKSVIVASYEDDAELKNLDANQFEYAGATINGIASDSTLSLADNQVAIETNKEFAAGDGSLDNLNDTSGAVESEAGVSSEEVKPGVQVSNDVTPTVTDAVVTNDNPDRVQITFSENIASNVTGNGNIDTAVTEAFNLTTQSGEELRIKNVSSADTVSDNDNTVILNLGESDGTSVTVEVGDDLTDALDYTPTAPSDSTEQYPIKANAGTEANVKAFDNQDVENQIGADLDMAEVTVTGEQLRVTFTENVTQVGTLSEIENAFEVGSSAIDIDSSGSYIGIEDGDTVVFDSSEGNFVVGELNSSTDLTGTNGINYTAADGGSPLEIDATGDPVSDFSEEDIENNIQPRIDGAEVTNDNPDKIKVTYSENVIEADGEDATSAFSLDGADTDVPEIDGINVDGDSTLVLSLDDDVEKDEDLGTLEYDGDDTGPIVSNETNGEQDSDAVAITPDSYKVDEQVGDSPVLEHVTVDDADENNDGDSIGEILLKFDRAVTATGTDASGFSFEGDDTAYNVSVKSLHDGETDSPDDVVIATIESESGSDSSMIEAHNDLDDASITVTDQDDVAIEGDADNNPIAENTVTDVRNEIAGDLTDVDSTKIDVELIGTEDDEKDSFNVTVTGFEDEYDTKVINDTVTLNMGGAKSRDIDLPRFGDTVEIEGTPEDISTDDVEVGSEVTVDVVDAEVESTENVTFVHEAYTLDADAGYQLTSQPMSGELVTTDEIGDITYYDANAAEDESDFGSYEDSNQVQRVHNGLFLNAESDGAEYGFAYDEDLSGNRVNVGSLAMDEGWHIVGSNYNISENAEIELREDLSIEGDINGSSVAVQDKSLPGTTLTDDHMVGQHEVYYVYLHQEDDRPIVLPEYDGKR